MRDRYGEITPDFDAWEKLGYYLEEIHSRTYTLCNLDGDQYDFIHIVASYDAELSEPEYTKEHFSLFINAPRCEEEKFTPEEQKQIELDIENFKKEKNNDR